MNCQCSSPGYCERFKRTMPERLWQCCQGKSGLSREKEEAMLKRLSEPTMFPSVVEQAVGFVGAAWKHIFAGMPSVTDEQYETRLAVCNNCPSCDKTDENWKCRECGCSLKEGVLMPGKARWASEDCPKGLWPKIELPVVKTGGCGGCGS